MKLFYTFLILTFFITSCEKDAELQHQVPSLSLQSPTLQQAQKSPTLHMSSTVYNGVSGDEVGSAKLVRNKHGLKVNFSANDLTPGYAYTLWWVIWNQPQECDTPGACLDPDFGNPDVEVVVLYGGGHVVGGSGVGHFSGHLKEGDASGSINDIFELPDVDGLDDAMKAEVHLVLRNHGPAVPGIVNEQIGGYLGGCTTDLGVFMGIPTQVGECGDTHFAVFAPPE